MNTFASFKFQLPSRAVQRILLAALVALGAATALSAWAQPGGHHGGGPGMMMFQGSPERMGRMIDHMLDGLSTTDAQRGQIKQIAEAAATDLKVQHEASATLRSKAMQIMTAPNIDAAQAEVVRQQMLAQHDQASRRMTQALLDVSRVLTPEQRVKLGERFKQREAQRAERMKH